MIAEITRRLFPAAFFGLKTSRNNVNRCLAPFLGSCSRSAKLRDPNSEVRGPSRRFLQELAKALPTFLCEFKLDTIPELGVPRHNAPGAADLLISEPQRDGNSRSQFQSDAHVNVATAL
jgi:hypothetical protein